MWTQHQRAGRWRSVGPSIAGSHAEAAIVSTCQAQQGLQNVCLGGRRSRAGIVLLLASTQPSVSIESISGALGPTLHSSLASLACRALGLRNAARSSLKSSAQKAQAYIVRRHTTSRTCTCWTVIAHAFHLVIQSVSTGQRTALSEGSDPCSL